MSGTRRKPGWMCPYVDGLRSGSGEVADHPDQVGLRRKRSSFPRFHTIGSTTIVSADIEPVQFETSDALVRGVLHDQ